MRKVKLSDILLAVGYILTALLGLFIIVLGALLTFNII